METNIQKNKDSIEYEWYDGQVSSLTTKQAAEKKAAELKKEKHLKDIKVFSVDYDWGKDWRVSYKFYARKMKKGGNVDGYDPNMRGYSVVYSKIIDGKPSDSAYKIDVAAIDEPAAEAEALKQLAPMKIKIETVRQYYKSGGAVDAPTSPRAFFKALKLSALPTEAAAYIDTQVLSDPDMDLLDVDDEDFVDVKTLIEESYPGAISGKATTEIEEPAAASPAPDEKAEWKDAIETLKMLIAAGGSKTEKTEWKDALETLEMLL